MSTYSRTHPLLSKMVDRYKLNRPGSTKATYHIALATETAHFPFQVGDSVAVLPENDPQEVKDIVALLGAPAEGPLFEFLLRKTNLRRCTSALVKALQERGAAGIEELLLPEKKSSLSQCHIAQLLARFPSRISGEELCSLVLPLMPRFYSIASSPLMHPNEIHLTVASATYTVEGHAYHGVGSHFLSHLARMNETPIPIYIQPSHGFQLPPDPDASILLVGPGTGIAPFRAFLQERMALQHKGRNWLFFGERHRATDFYYEDYWLALEKENRLRLDLAFSRDQVEKIYVQHRLWEQRASVWDWLQNGAYFYVCGDASEMAHDVETMLQKIGVDQGGFSEEEARQWTKALRKAKRYRLDVY